MLESLLRALRASIPGVRTGRDPEKLHLLRVATRRRRAALRLFHEMLPSARSGSFKKELKWLAGEVAAVRDLDVQMAQLRENYCPTMTCRILAREAFLAWLDGRRRAARVRLLRALSVKRCAGLLESGRRLLEKIPEERRPPADSMAKAVRRAARRAVDVGRRLGGSASAPQLHRFRIRCKRVRYLAEIAGGCTGRAAFEVAARFKALQDALGIHQDAVVGQRLLRSFARRAKADRVGLAGLAGWYLARAERARCRFFVLFGQLESKRARRRLLQPLKGTASGEPRRRTIF